MRDMSSTDTAAIARELKQPLLFAGVSATSVTAQSLREAVPHAQFAQVVDAGHFVHLDVPDQFNTMLQRFIQRL